MPCGAVKRHGVPAHRSQVTAADEPRTVCIGDDPDERLRRQRDTVPLNIDSELKALEPASIVHQATSVAPFQLAKTAVPLGLDWAEIKARIAYLPQELPSWQGDLRDNLHFEAALHGILGEDTRIAAIAPSADLARAFPDAAVKAFPKALLMPGLVNAHCHSGILRGTA